jgi:ribosomal protein L29
MVEKVNDHSQFGKIKRDVARLLTEQSARATKKETAR